MFGQRNFEKAVETIFNNIEPTWQQEFRFAIHLTTQILQKTL